MKGFFIQGRKGCYYELEDGRHADTVDGIEYWASEVPGLRNEETEKMTTPLGNKTLEELQIFVGAQKYICELCGALFYGHYDVTNYKEGCLNSECPNSRRNQTAKLFPLDSKEKWERFTPKFCEVMEVKLVTCNPEEAIFANKNDCREVAAIPAWFVHNFYKMATTAAFNYW